VIHQEILFLRVRSVKNKITIEHDSLKSHKNHKTQLPSFSGGSVNVLSNGQEIDQRLKPASWIEENG
jgi:hypothetical protein